MFQYKTLRIKSYTTIVFKIKIAQKYRALIGLETVIEDLNLVISYMLQLVFEDEVVVKDGTTTSQHSVEAGVGVVSTRLTGKEVQEYSVELVAEAPEEVSGKHPYLVMIYADKP